MENELQSRYRSEYANMNDHLAQIGNYLIQLRRYSFYYLRDCVDKWEENLNISDVDVKDICKKYLDRLERVRVWKLQIAIGNGHLCHIRRPADDITSGQLKPY